MFEFHLNFKWFWMGFEHMMEFEGTKCECYFNGDVVFVFAFVFVFGYFNGDGNQNILSPVGKVDISEGGVILL